MSEPTALIRIAERIDTDEDFAMRVGEDARATLEAEGVPDHLIAEVLERAKAPVAGFALGAADVRATVTRVAAAAREVAVSSSA